jgi:riboflavin synthase
MFTGIVSDLGTILKIEKKGDLRIRILCSFGFESILIGSSICCNGVCLTVIEKTASEPTSFDVEVSSESLSKSNVGSWKEGTKINLERSLKLGDELGGHIVSGHVDGVVKVLSLLEQGNSTKVVLECPKPLAKFIAHKGSVALNGTSLTVNDVLASQFSVNLISHTKEVTNWKLVKPNDEINIEVDTLARYVSRLIEC